MVQYEIIETDEGLTVTEIAHGLNSEETAMLHHAVLIDPGPFETYEDAFDALMALKLDDEEDDEELS